MPFMTFMPGVLMRFSGGAGEGSFDGGGFPVHAFHQGIDVLAGQTGPRNTGGGESKQTDEDPGADGGVQAGGLPAGRALRPLRGVRGCLAFGAAANPPHIKSAAGHDSQPGGGQL